MAAEARGRFDATGFVLGALAVAEMEARKILHNSSALWVRAIQPALWLIVFGEALSGVRGLSPNGVGYVEFITPGILSQSVLFIAIFYGVTLVWERDMGLLNKLMTTPVPTSSIVVGKALAASIRGIFQAVVIFALALIIGVGIQVTIVNGVLVTAVVILLAICFSSISMIIASIVKTRERMMGLGQALTFPLFFASNAIYPKSVMPAWLQIIAEFNPLTYGVDGIRAMLISGDYSTLPQDVGVLALYSLVLVVIASKVVRRIVD